MTISVALCTYNGEKYIEEQINSILNQSIAVNEIIVCDDQSTDDTITILEKYATKNPNLFKIYRNEKNLKSIKNFEKAIALCSGDIIFLADQDDVWVPKKVEDYLHHFHENPTINVLASNGFCIDENSKIHEKYSIWDVPEFLKENDIKFDYFKLITFSNIATGASMAFRKKIVSEIIPFPIIDNFNHDEWIAIFSSKNKSFELLNEKYFYYRIHEQQQIGGVFFDKNIQEKLKLINFYNLNENNIAFVGYKVRLKRFYSTYLLNQQLANLFPDDNSYNENLIETKKAFYKTKKEMIKRFPISSFFLNILDKMLNKRQIDVVSRK